MSAPPVQSDLSTQESFRAGTQDHLCPMDHQVFAYCAPVSFTSSLVTAPPPTGTFVEPYLTTKTTGYPLCWSSFLILASEIGLIAVLASVASYKPPSVRLLCVAAPRKIVPVFPSFYSEFFGFDIKGYLGWS